MTPEEFEKLIQQREGETLDFKQEMVDLGILAVRGTGRATHYVLVHD